MTEYRRAYIPGAPFTQEQLGINGHAFEARIYAEDPERDFLPSIGRLEHLRTPPEGPHVRIDTGIRQGDEVSLHYDPLLAKLIVWDRDRDNALRRLRRALAEYQVVGVTTNLAFLFAVASHPAFANGELNTGFIEQHRVELFPDQQPASDRILAVEEQYQFILPHRVMQQETEVDMAVAMGEATQAWFPELSSCRFEQGFQAPAKQSKLAKLVAAVIMPKGGRLAQVQQAWEQAQECREGRRQPAAIESAIPALEVHGLNCCPDRGLPAFRR